METSQPSDDFAQGRILALRTALGALMLSHPHIKQARREIAQSLMQAESKWLASRASDLFIEGLQAESADLQAQLNTSLSLRVPNTRTTIPPPSPQRQAAQKENPPGSES